MIKRVLALALIVFSLGGAVAQMVRDSAKPTKSKTPPARLVTQDMSLSSIERLLQRLIANRRPADGRLWLAVWLTAEFLTLWSWIGFALDEQTPANQLVPRLVLGVVGFSSPFVAYSTIRAARADGQGNVSRQAETEALRAARNVMGVVLGVVLYLGSLLGIEELLARREAPITVAVTFIGLIGGAGALGLSVALHRRRTP